MKTEIRGTRIRLSGTIQSDINKIIEFEKLNSQFVNQYTFDKHLEVTEDDNYLHLSIKRLDNDCLIGHIILSGLQSINSEIEFRRITINEKGEGFGREALKLLKKLCFEKFNCHRLWLDVYDDNERAYKLYESEGFILDGILRENVKTESGYRSQRIYSILENEYHGKS